MTCTLAATGLLARLMAYRQSVGCRTCRALAPTTWPPETTAANWPFRLGSKLYKAGPVSVVLRPDTTPVLRFNHVSAAMEKMLWSVLLLLPTGHNAAARLGAAEKRLRDYEESVEFVPNVTPSKH